MAEAEKKKTKKSRPEKAEPPPRQRTDDFVTRYSNGVTIVNTQFDMQFMFGQLTFEPDKNLVIREHTLIAMNPLHAKSFYQLLEKRLNDWEKTFGVIELKKPAATQTEK